MKVHQFNREGISVFNESNLVTELHAHPALEIILAKKGNFSLHTQKESLINIKYGLIKPNAWHRLQATHCECEIIMVEPVVHHRAQLGVYLRLLDIDVPAAYGPSADDYDIILTRPFGD